MVTIEEIQAAYYMVAATGVLVAAGYYILNMKATLETRRIGLIENISTRLINAEGFRAFQELMNYEWTDYDDFEKKYGSDFNLDSSSKRYATWTSYNTVGAMLRKGMVDAEDIYDMGLFAVVLLWEKYRPVIEEIRRRYFGRDYLKDLEFLSEEMLKIVREGDPSYKIPEAFTKYIPDK